MIYYNKAQKAFLLAGKDVSYTLFVNPFGRLQNLHFGERIGEDDLEYLISHIASTYIPQHNENLAQGIMPLEIGSYARGDFRDSTALIVRGDGAAMSAFSYRSHKIKKGVPAVVGMPHARSGGETLSVTLKDEFSETELVLHYTVWDDLNVVVRNVEYKNTGSETVELKRAFSFCLDLPDEKYDVLRLHGDWGKERTPELTALGHGTLRLQSLRGASSHTMNPFMGILREHCTETAGECYGVQLIYSGSFALTAERSYTGRVRVQGGIEDTNFCWKLGAGETFTTPQAVLSYSAKGLGELSRSFVDFLRERVVNPAWAYKRRPVVVNNWEATSFNFTNERLFAIIDEAAGLGIDTFVLDDGWFGKRDSDNSGLGDWFVNENKLQGGLKAVIDRCKKNKLKFGLWFEPEMISEDSDLYRAHPDYAIGKYGQTPVRGRNQLVLDFARKEVVDYVFDVVSKVLAENDISYVKWDMNRSITECFSQGLPAEKQGEFMHRNILGVYDLAERLLCAFPKIFFEGCASGGGRFDAGMLYYFPQIWTSDDSDAFERTKIQWGTGICYPVSSMSCHVSACPNGQVYRTTPFETRGAVASLGATGYELDLSQLTEEEKELAKAQIANYKRIEELVLKGDLYRLSDPFTQNYFCEMLVSKDKKSAYVAGERILGDPCYQNEWVRLYGLADDKIYRIEELNVTASGKALSSAGVLFPRLNDFGSWTWHIEEAE